MSAPNLLLVVNDHIKDTVTDKTADLEDAADVFVSKVNELAKLMAYDFIKSAFERSKNDARS